MYNFRSNFVSSLKAQTGKGRIEDFALMFKWLWSFFLGARKKAQKSIIKYHLQVAHLQALSFHSSSPFMFNNLILSDIKYFIYSQLLKF